MASIQSEPVVLPAVTLFSVMSDFLHDPPVALKLGNVYKPDFVNVFNFGSDDESDESDESEGPGAGEETKEPKSRSQKLINSDMLDMLKTFYCAHSGCFSTPFNIATTSIFKTPLPASGEELMELCSQSGFGDLSTATTKVDLGVRTAFELRPALSTLFETEVIPKLEQLVSEKLYFNRRIRLVFNKLNVYGPGGFFKKHVDTPKPNNIGTFVIELPDYEYKGGEFVVENRNKDLFGSYWDRQLQETVTPNIGAFYSNIPHQVDQVTSGHRVSLTFYVMADWTDRTEHPLFDLVLDSQQQRFERLCSEYFASTEQKAFGIFLNETYSAEEIGHQFLRGSDEMVAHQLSKTEYDLEFLPVLMVHTERHTACDENLMDYDCKQMVEEKVYRLKESDIMNYHLRQPFDPLGLSSPLLFFNARQQRSVSLQEHEVQGVEYTGNESQDGFFQGHYFQVALLVKLKEEVAKKQKVDNPGGLC